MSTLRVDRITPFQSSSVTIEGNVIQPNAATTGSNTFVGNQIIQGTITASIQEGFALVGGVGNVSTLVATSSFGGALPSGVVSGSAQISSLGFATTGSNTFVAPQILDNTSLRLTGSNGGGSQIHIYQGGTNQIRFYSGSNDTQVGTWVNMQVNPSNGAIAISAFPQNNHFVDFNPAVTESQFTAPIRIEGGIVGNTSVTGSLTISGSSATDLRVIGNQVISGTLDITSSEADGFAIINRTNTIGQYFGNLFGGNIGIYTLANLEEIGFALDGATWTTNWGNGPLIYVNNTPGDTYEGVFGFQNKANYTDGRITALKRLDVSGSINPSPNNQVKFQTGSNQQAGTVVLDGGNPGTVTVSNNLVTANSIIILTKQTFAHSGVANVSSKGSNTFTITSTANGDTDTVGYLIINNV